MRSLRILTAVFLSMGCVATYGSAASAAPAKQVQDYIREPLPPGIQVLNTELEGPVFTNAQGHTLYRWPPNNMRNGDAGEAAGKPACFDTHYKETAGFTSPWPAGNLLPDADTRPTCIQHWPIVVAPEGAQPVGNFTIISRSDGIKQWAYKGYALYTSHLDTAPGETYGASFRRGRDEVSGGAVREPVGPAPAVPAQFKVATMAFGRMLTTPKGQSIYAYNKDKPNKSNCNDACAQEWTPVLAPEFAVPQSEWSVVTRRGGEKQWAYRGQPLYTHVLDTKERSYEGSDVAGWSNVYMQMSPNAPKGFGVMDTYGGMVRTDPHGKAIYFYQCVEDTPDTLYCDTPDTPQVYRWAMCGGGDVDRCNKSFPYVIADKGAKADSIAWSIRDIDPKSGRYVAEGTPGSLHIWAFRGRPIYTFAGDQQPGDIEADSWGQDHGQRNGFTAFWVRDDFAALDSGRYNN